MGVMLGWGPCLSFCTPILISYIAGSQQGWLRGLWNVLVFSVTRVLAYIILAIVAVSIGHTVVRSCYETSFGQYIYLGVSIIVILLGVLLLLNKSPHFRLCRRLIKSPIRNNVGGMSVLGLIIGFSPCIPLFGVLAYIAFEAKSLFQAVFYGACFGAGTILTPLIPMGILAGGFPSLLLRKPVIFDIFTRICGCFLIYFGIKLITGGTIN